jgi:hypothetical protein
MEPRERDAQLALDWVRPPRSKFMESEAYRVLKASLSRYAAGELSGRSFLISGHRGAGKTTLVARVVQDCNETAFDDCGDLARYGDDEKLRERGLRRLLLVRLHGPSLVATPAAAQKKSDEEPTNKVSENEGRPPSAKPIAAAAQSSAADKGAPESEEAQISRQGQALRRMAIASLQALAAKPEPAAQSDDAQERLAQSALKQITIALYRAMADEFAVCFAYQSAPTGAAANPASAAAVSKSATFSSPGTAERLYELAGQFRLDLDQGIEPGALREYWDQVGCLRRGVLWPRQISEFAEKAGLPDQGMRELQALATAAQAFQVCSGAIEHKRTIKDANAREQTFEAKFGIDLPGALNRAIGLMIGGLVGYGAAGALGAAGGIGTVAAAGGLWSARRSRKREENLDYTFIRDFTLQTLERDLPLVIERVRAAGLAPVFVVDELDKIEDPKEIIPQLIDRLKHLTTDYAFFCFLSGREYYQYVEERIQDQAYPPEHSYFSERLFVVYTTDELAVFLGKIIVVSEPTKPPRPPRLFALLSWLSTDKLAKTYDDTAKAMLVRIILHRSKLNTIDVMRELERWFSPGGELLQTSEAFIKDRANQVAVAMQLAVECALAESDVAQQMRHSSLVRQFVIDAVYWISRNWEANEGDFTRTKQAFAEYLIKRLKSDRRPKPNQQAEKPDKAEIRSIQQRRFGSIKFDDLWKICIADPLFNFEKVSRWAETHLIDSDNMLLSPIPLDFLQFIKPKGEDKFGFDFNVFGNYTGPGVTREPEI